MNKIWYYIYNILIVPTIYMIFFILSFLNKKVKLGFIGRKKLFENLIIELTGINKSNKYIWFHSSSMGEFEQAKPIIEKIKSLYEVNIIVTFFSPSGYNNSKNYPFADIVSYLPFDSYRNAKRFIDILKPDAAIFMRYDIWPNFIWRLNKRKIPTFIVDATMRDTSRRIIPIIKQFHKILFKNVTKILTVTDNDLENFTKFGLNRKKLLQVGDTRFDRVYLKSLSLKERIIINDNIISGKKVIIVGSSWEPDESILIPVFQKLYQQHSELLFIIVPHEPIEIKLEKLEYSLNGKLDYIRFSQLNNYNNEKVIIVDAIGLLLGLYKYAYIAYVGGGFKAGIHNVLEPAVYGIPVIFGPKYENSNEAKQMLKMETAFSITSSEQVYKIISSLLINSESYSEIVSKNNEYIKSNVGATDKITAILREIIFT